MLKKCKPSPITLPLYSNQPHPSDPNSTPEATLTSLLETPFQLEPRHPPQTMRDTINNY
jgi:hypothetical protein